MSENVNRFTKKKQKERPNQQVERKKEAKEKREKMYQTKRETDKPENWTAFMNKFE